jgi:peptidoglycan-associated lipoprotein
MKKRTLFKKQIALLSFCALALLLGACHRSSREFWEDTKTAGRYVGKGMHSLFGRHVDSYPLAYQDWEDEQGYQFADDNATYCSSTSSFAGMEDLGKGIPLSKESPGDPGCPIPGIDGFFTPSGELAALFKNIHFETDQYVIKGPENLKAVEKIAHYLMRHPNLYIFVEGHADQRGAAAYNLSLGSKRANSVRNLLVQSGVNPDRLFTVSYGKERPIATEHSEFAWQINRRAQFKVYER